MSNFHLFKRFLSRWQHSPAFRSRRASAHRSLTSPLRLEELEQRLVLTVPTPDHVVVVMEENHGYGDIIGDTTDAPYINNTLLKDGASFTNSFAVTHPSEPNYFALFSGSTQGVTDDGVYNFSAPNLAASLIAKGLTFGGYAEDLPSVGFTGATSGAYARKHAPYVSFTNVPTSVNMPFTSFPTDYSTLPTVSFVIPNLNDDMHDGTIAQADTWLKNNIDGYAQWAKTHNSLLIVTWDEAETSSTNQIPTLFVGAQVAPGNYSETINHYNVLRTIETMYGLSPLTTNDANATPITDVWAANFDKLGAYRASDGSWSLDSDGGRTFNPATSQVFLHFSPPNVTGVAGDWNGTGRSQIGDFSNGVWHLDLNGNGVVDPGETFQFGQAGDQPVVGDWDGNPSGRDELGVFRAAPDGITGEFILDIANHKTMDSSNLVFTFGLATDHVIVGDWNGKGTTEVGVYRDAKSFIPADAGDAVFSINSNGDHATFTNFVFGLITDHVVIGDWTGSGTSKVGVYRDGSNGFNAPGVALFSLDSGALMFNAQSQVFLFGLVSDQFVSGNWPPTPPLLPAQFAAAGAGPGGVPPLTDAELAPVVQQAIANWAAQGADPAQLESASLRIGQLGGNLVGWTSGTQITLDATADGWGWNLDTSGAAFTSAGASGLQARPGTAAAGQMDLLTVVEHELGHELGLSDVDPAAHPSDIMAATLPLGTRRNV